MTRIRQLILWLVIGAVLCGFLFHWYRSHQILFVRFDGEQLIISDFAYYVFLIREFWEGGIRSIYRLTDQLTVVSALVGAPRNEAMPVGVTPAALLVWAPFAELAGRSVALSSSIWTALSLCVLGAAFAGNIGQCAGRFARWYAGLFMICALGSALAVRAISLGQTSLIATGSILLLLQAVRSTDETRFSRTKIFLLLFILALKPPYIFVGIVALIAYRKHREALLGLGMILIFFLIISAKLGVLWPLDYLGQLRVYLMEPLPEHYAASIQRTTMNSFGAAVCGVFGVERALSYSLFLYLLFAFVSLSAAFITACPRAPGSAYLSKYASPLFLSLLPLAAYQLFAPYLGAYEDILLASFCAVAPLFADTQARRRPITALVLLCFLFSYRNWASVVNPLIPWAAKLIFCLLMLRVACIEHRQAGSRKIPMVV